MAKRPTKYYSMSVDEEKRTAEIVIYGDITSWPWLESDVSAFNLQKEISALDVDAIDVHINSYGGEVAEALAIFNTLRRHPADVTTYVDGFACSAATIIFMAGNKRVVSPVSNFLVHPASVWTSGNAEQLRREAENLDAITEQSITAYMQSVTKSREELVDLMAEERFLTPEEVLEWGFATEIDDILEKEEDKATQAVGRLIQKKLLGNGDSEITALIEANKNLVNKLEEHMVVFAMSKPEPERPPQPPLSYQERLRQIFNKKEGE